MSLNRRTVLKTSSSGILLALAGCIDSLHFSGNVAKFDQNRIDENQYNLIRSDQRTEEIEIESRSVSADITQLIYNHIEFPELLFIISTPSVSQLNREFNPLAVADTEDVISFVDSYIPELSTDEIEKINEFTHNTTLGETQMEVFEVTRSEDNMTVEVELYIGSISTEDSVITYGGTIISEEMYNKYPFESNYNERQSVLLSICSDISYPVRYTDIE